MSAKWEAEEIPAAAAADQKEFKLALFHISFFMSAGALFMLLSFFLPGISTRFQILCWQTAMVAFFSAAVITRRHPVVLSQIILRWSGQRNQKPKPAVAAVTERASHSGLS
ncbi:unnamed protein product [Urochloa humidicola]